MEAERVCIGEIGRVDGRRMARRREVGKELLAESVDIVDDLADVLLRRGRTSNSAEVAAGQTVSKLWHAANEWNARSRIGVQDDFPRSVLIAFAH